MDLKEVMAINLRRLRHAKGMTQEELAERAGLSARYIGAIERADVSGSTVRLYLAQPLPANGRVVYPAGYAMEHRRGDFVRDNLYDEVSGCPGMPLRSYLGVGLA